MNREELVRSLIRGVADGSLDARLVQPVLQNLSAGEGAAPPLGDLLDAIRALDGPAAAALAGQVGGQRRRDAAQHQSLRIRGAAVSAPLRDALRDLPHDLPLGWGPRESAYTRVQAALKIIADRFFFLPHQSKAPTLAAALEQRYQEAVANAFQNGSVWSHATLVELLSEVERISGAGPDLARLLPVLKERIERRRQEALAESGRALAHPDQPLPPGLDPGLFLESVRARYTEVSGADERRRLLELLCRWQGDAVAPVLMDLPLDAAAQERASMLLTLRFGHAEHATWDAWVRWLRGQVGLKAGGEGSRAVVRKRPLAMLYLWYSRLADRDADLLAALERQVVERLDPVTMDAFVDRWAKSIPPDEWQALTGEEIEIVEIKESKPVPPPVAFTATPAPKPRPVVPKPPPKPSIWEVHLKPFFLENWYMVAGVMMVLVGSSLLAYYTWGKSALLQYTLMPAMLGGFTATLAWVGSWIERKDQQFKDTAAVLRAAAIGLLPVNFMAVALLASDDKVAHREVFVPLMGAIYLGLFGLGLRSWCAKVHDRLGFMLGGTLLFLNSLVAVAPLARVLSPADTNILPIVGTGFYLGFAALVGAVVQFSKSVLTVELAKDKRVVWFFGATLAVTFLQVFAWVHGYLKHLPHVQTYAPMVVLTGGLVLYIERRMLELRGEAERHGAESFLGFAFILAGVLMGLAHPAMRITAFSLAGVVWIASTLQRKHPLHAWIGLTLAVLGGASVGLLQGFPPAWMPSLGIALALGLGLFGLLVRSSDLLARAAGGMKAAVLIVTVVVTVLAQLRSGSNPPIAAGHLAGVAALFGVLAWREQKIRWAQTGMSVLALALPYLTGFDLQQQILHSTSLVAGLVFLSVLWIAATLWFPSPILAGARSTVLWIYGGLALACMVARGTIDDAASLDSPWIEIGGPTLMVAVLVWAGWFSRSWIPMLMAMLIGLILTPELKDHVSKLYPDIAWGSGLGSALSAVAYVLIAFRLRAMPKLQTLGEGDLYMGSTPYPLRCLNYKLFTLPLIASAIFLTAKIEMWNFLSHTNNIRVQTAFALLLSGASWTLLAVYLRGYKGAKATTYIGLFWIIVGSLLACGRLITTAPHAATFTLIAGVLVQALFFLHRFVLEPRYPWAADLLTGPTRRVLRLCSLGLSVILIACYLFEMPPDTETGLLTTFVGLQLAWHGLASRHIKYGFQLYLLDWWVLVAVLRHSGGGAWVTTTTVTATLMLVIAVQALQVALEFKKPYYEFLRPLMLPFQGLSSLVAGSVGVLILFTTFSWFSYSNVECGLAVVALLLSGRALRCAPFALLAALAAYFGLHSGNFAAGLSPSERTTLLLTPWHASLFGLALAGFGYVGRLIASTTPQVVSGRYAPQSTKTWPATPWLDYPALFIVGTVALLQIWTPAEWEARAQVGAPYIGAATIALAAFSMGLRPLLHGVGAFLSLGNILAIRTFLGEPLRRHGLSEVHLIALGIAITLLQGSLLRRIVREESIVRLINRSSLAWAGLVLLLISANYLVDPNLDKITWERFAISGGMAFLAGWYFRRAARQPAPGEEPFVVGCEGLYHFGVTITFWCAALMIPALRSPYTALVALGVPVLYLFARAESGFRRSTETFARYRASAATVGFVVLGLYALRAFVQMVAFPDRPFDTLYYHANSPVIIVLGLVLLRLHGQGGTSWLAFYGGLAVMAGSYFAVTSLPGLSPFNAPVASAWAAVAMAHFYTIASIQHSPLRTGIQRLARIDANQWHDLRRPWGVCLLVAVHGMAFWGCLHQELMIAPLILGAASVLVHQGILRQSRLYPILAQIETVAALHAGFLFRSYLPQNQVVWTLLALWGLVLVAQPLIVRVAPSWKPGAHVLILAFLTGLHILFVHGPASTAGLWAFGIATLLFVVTPKSGRQAEGLSEMLCAAAPVLAPAWLVWFSQARTLELAATPWPTLVTSATLLATGTTAMLIARGMVNLQSTALKPRLYDHSGSFLAAHGARIHSVLLWFTFGVTVLVQVAQGGHHFKVREAIVIEGLYAAFAVAAWFEGSVRKAMAPYILMEFCVLGGFLVARQQLPWWNYEYDVWASLAAFFAFVGLKQILDQQPRELKIPVKSALLLLPAFSVAWIAMHHLGTNLGLVVIGLHSAAFAYMGREERESPYHLIAVGGFTSFVLLLFYSKLHLTTVYAYVIPVGLGVLVLLQLFRERVAPDARNIVRTVVLLAMIGSAGWAALLDEKIPLMHNLAVMLLCLGAMGLGGFLRIRLYIGIGFGALMLDLVVIFVKAVATLDRTARMTIVGSSVLVLGAALVFGAIYYKTHKQEIGNVIDRWRLRFSGWE